MLSSVKEKRCLLCCGMFSVVMTELSYRQPFSPIVLLLIDKDVEVFLNILIHSFRLSVSGRVKGGRSILLDAKEVK